MLVLGIETSCDETAAAVVKDGKKVFSSVVSSSSDFHRRYGGVVPEIACRRQSDLIDLVTGSALAQAKAKLDDVGLVAVTAGPGLVGALLVGISFAKTLSFCRGLPLVGVNHLEAHLYANFLDRRGPEFPFVGLLVSGGHTALVLVKDFDDYRLLGSTLDDAGGEAFDKVAKLMGLGYPGGPEIDRLGAKGDRERIKFPRSYLEEDSLDFSFSGIKTAVLNYLQKHPLRGKGKGAAAADVAAGFQEAVVDVLVDKAALACRKNGVRRLAAGGGVSVNSRLRQRLKERAGKEGLRLYFPLPGYCLDNGAMVAGRGYWEYRRRGQDDFYLTAVPNLEIGRGSVVK